MNLSELDAHKLSDTQKTALLYHNAGDGPKPGDCIFVPGSSKAVEYRLPKALELYNEGFAEKLLFSGGVVWDGNSLTEAELLAKGAISMGVPEKDILIENKSLHSKENVLASMFVLDREFDLHLMHRLIVVTAAIHMRRMHLILQTYMPSWIKYSLCPVDDNATKENSWFDHPYGRKRVNRETKKLIDYAKRGVIIDPKVTLPD
ncbi:MAG TPA: YdcF family protein [Virgibacillus sp.]|nr:YdcF family protein [Virgibacillus sp.]